MTKGQHHFEQSENIIVRLRTQMNDVALRAALEAAKTALEATDNASTADLTTKMEEADAARKGAIDTLSTELNDMKQKTGALENTCA